MIWLEYLPLPSFILLLIFIAVKSFCLARKKIRIRSSFPKNQWILLPFYALVLLTWVLINTPFFNAEFISETIKQPLFHSGFVSVFGGVCVLISLILLVFSLFDFGQSFRFGKDKNNTGPLITGGVFSYSRNPFFLSLLVFFFGTLLISPGVFNLLFFAASFAGIHFAILKEEKFMLENYGDEYKKYQNTVRRYFGRKR